ncbi:MAG TPA: helicase-associated domain-containing protein [Actinomycetota bacterium]|nr:helicase-associated domain-containing protein [Actinomycetota bacterium]
MAKQAGGTATNGGLHALPASAIPAGRQAGTLASHLRALERADLEELLRRRPETKALWSAPRLDVDQLAECLARPEGIQAAVAGLDGFVNCLLLTALWLLGEADAAELADQAPGVEPAALLDAARELARSGLGFPVTLAGGSPCASPSASPGGRPGWRLQLPPQVVAALGPLRVLGPPVSVVLSGKTVPFLSAVVANLGVLPGRGASRDRLVAEIRAALANREVVTGALGKAPVGAREVLERVRAEGGIVGYQELAADRLASSTGWNERQPTTTPTAWLESRGFLVRVADGYGASDMLIPAEVETALRDGRLFPSWPEPVPPSLATSSGNASPATSADPNKILADLESLVGLWEQEAAPSVKKGGLGTRELRRAAKTLGLPEPYMGFLYALAVQGHLIAYDDRRRVVPSSTFRTWAMQPAARRWDYLFQGWMEGMVWQDGRPLVGPEQLVHKPGLVHLRRSIVAELAGLAPDEATSVPALSRRLFWRLPSVIHCEDCATAIVEGAVQALAWLGTATLGRATSPAIALLEPARSGASDPGWANRDGPARRAFPEAVDTCAVGADLTIVVPGPPEPALGAALSRFADLQASSPARVYRLSESSLRRGLDGGLGGAEILEVLARHAPKGVPQSVSYLIEDVARRHGSLQVGRAGLYVRSTDPALLAGVVRDRLLKKLAPRLLAPTVAVFAGEDAEALLSALRAGGYLPVADPEGATLLATGAPTLAPVIPPVPRDRSNVLSWPRLGRSEAAALAQAIVSATRVGGAGKDGVLPGGEVEACPVETEPTGIVALCKRALIDREAVELTVVDRQDRSATFVVERVVVSGPTLYACDVDSGRPRAIALNRVTCARSVGEASALRDRAQAKETLDGARLARLLAPASPG